MRSGERSGHHRGLRPGHGVTGGAWKRGRANGVLVENIAEQAKRYPEMVFNNVLHLADARR